MPKPTRIKQRTHTGQGRAFCNQCGWTTETTNHTNIGTQLPKADLRELTTQAKSHTYKTGHITYVSRTVWQSHAPIYDE